MTDKPPLTEFDIVTIPTSFQIMKAMLPYLDIHLQKNLSLIIRFMELKQTIDFFNYADNITSMSAKSVNTDNNANLLTNLLKNEGFINSIAPYLPENYKSMLSAFKMFSSMSDLFNQDNMDLSDILGKYMGGVFNTDNTDNTNKQEDTAQDADNNINPDSGNNPKSDNNTSEADKGFSIFSNAMNQEQQKLYDEYLNQLDHLNLQQ